MELAGDISFGVYLAHPLVIAVLAAHGLGPANQIMTAWAATAVMFLGTAVGAALIAYAARSSPLSLPLAGRPRPISS